MPLFITMKNGDPPDLGKIMMKLQKWDNLCDYELKQITSYLAQNTADQILNELGDTEILPQSEADGH